MALGDRRLDGGSRLYLADLLREAGELESADREAQRAVQTLDGVPTLRAEALGILARVRLARGRPSEAVEAAREAMGLLDESESIEEGESLVRLVHAEALHAAGDPVAARAVLEAARERLLARAGRIGDEGLRESFLTRVPENARTLELARSWLT